MMKKKNLAFPIVALALASCSETSNLFSSRAYMSDAFEQNYFSVNPYKGHEAEESHPIDSSKYFNGEKDASFRVSSSITRQGPRTMYPNIFVYKSQDLTQMNYTIAHEKDDSAYIGKDWGRTKCCSKQHMSFRKGIESKLYDGQLFCYNYHSAALIQVPSTGFGDKFDCSMATGDYFLLSMRGGSTIGVPRISSLDLNVTFYKGLEPYSLTLENVYLRTDSGGESDTFVGFRFSDALPGFSTEGISGVSISYSNLQDPDAGADENTTPDGTHDAYWGLLIYEMMFVDATWR